MMVEREPTHECRRKFSGGEPRRVQDDPKQPRGTRCGGDARYSVER
jgi:hypothetical protein